ncbi:MAG TPA: PAS domain S-box protein, partial [Cytophagales bacterium]|nr:PAS domain S-box protein [Cytophagales bacterium]
MAYYLIPLALLPLILLPKEKPILLYIGMLLPLCICMLVVSKGSHIMDHQHMIGAVFLGGSILTVFIKWQLNGPLSSNHQVSPKDVGSDFEFNKYSCYENLFLWSYNVSKDQFTIVSGFTVRYGISVDFNKIPLEQFLKYVEKDQHSLFNEAFKEVHNKSLSFEFEVRVADALTWFELNGSAAYKDDGTCIVSGVLVDITSKKQLEKRLFESYLDIENILNYSPSGILITSNSKIQYVNAEFLKMVNMDRTSLISTDTPFQLLPNENMQYLDFANKAYAGESEGHEFKLVRADETYLDVLLMHKHVKYKGEDANLVVISDYTSRSKYLAALKEKEASAKANEDYANRQKKLLEEILSSLPLMLSIYDENGKLYLNNKWMTDKFGWDAKDLEDIECLSKTVNDPVNHGLLQKSLQARSNTWVSYKMRDKAGAEHLTEWACIKTDNNFLIRLGIDISEKTKIKADYESAIEQLQLLNQKLVAREERLDSNQEQLKEANIKLYEQNKILEESENKFKLLSEASHEAIFMLDEGVIFDHNQSACKLLGYDSNDLKKIHISDLVVPSQRSSILEILNNNSSVENFDITFVKNSGRLFYGELQSKPFMYKGKNVLVFTVRDITYRKRIEMEARNNEVNIRNLIDNINIGVYLKMSTGETFSNQTLAKILGVERVGEEFDFMRHVDPRYVGELSDAIESVVKSESASWSKDIIVVNTLANTQSEVNITLVNTTYKLKSALLLSVIDINQRKKAERELQVSYAYQNALLNSGDISYWAADRSFKLLFANQYHEVITKKYFNTQIAIGQDVRQEFKKIVDEKDIEKDFQAVLKGENITRVVKTLNDQGQHLWLEFNLSPINIAGEITGVLVRTKDVTGNFNQMERIRQSEERLREAQLLAKVGNWEENEDKTEVYWSAGLFKIFGLKSGFEPQTNSLQKLLGPDNQERFVSHYHEALVSQQQVEREYKLRSESDDRWLRVVIVRSAGKGNKIKGTVQDITESKFAENKIKDNENLLNTIIDNLPVIFHMFDSKGLSLR